MHLNPRTSLFVEAGKDRLKKAEKELAAFFEDSLTPKEMEYRAALALCWVRLAITDLEGYSK